MKHAINELKMVLEIAKNNESIQRAEGRIDKADYNAEIIVDITDAIKALEIIVECPYTKLALDHAQIEHSEYDINSKLKEAHDALSGEIPIIYYDEKQTELKENETRN